MPETSVWNRTAVGQDVDDGLRLTLAERHVLSKDFCGATGTTRPDEWNLTLFNSVSMSVSMLFYHRTLGTSPKLTRVAGKRVSHQRGVVRRHFCRPAGAGTRDANLIQ